jgi:trk system potassium uptake protein TrkA
LIPDEHTVFQEGDLLHMMVRDEDLANVEKSFSHAPESAS